MKKVSLVVLLILMVVFLAETGCAQEKPRMGVLRFTNQTSAGWWSGSVGRDLQDMLIAELAAMKTFTVLERKEIDAVLGEQDLGASGRIDSSTRAKIGQLKGAQYLVAASVSAYEEDTKGGDAGIRVGGVSVGGKRDNAYIAVDLKVIDTTTGEIIDARTVEAEAASGGLRGGFSRGKLGGSLGGYEKTPAGKAIRACIMEIAEYLECSLVKGRDHSCMSDYDAKESRRREKTKKSIKF